jgi:hypothetical protein
LCLNNNINKELVAGTAVTVVSEYPAQRGDDGEAAARPRSSTGRGAYDDTDALWLLPSSAEDA